MKDTVDRVLSSSISATVIVPLFNCIDDLEGLFESLGRQRAEGINYEILFVDNGSTDGTFERAVEMVKEQQPRIRTLQEPARGSYAARNKGVRESDSEFVCFTDSDCRPSEDWLLAGVKKLKETGAHVAGGAVEFTFPQLKRSVFEVFDAETNMQIERDIQSRQVAKTANLFVRREAFDRVGLFDAALRSGGDVSWTAVASGVGLGLVYAKEAVVRHPARGAVALLNKQIRVGEGKSALRGLAQESLRERNQSALATFFRLRSVTEFKGLDGFLKLFCVCFLCQIAGTLGRIKHILGS
jgi:glycosyltransferase involved in cell wall biosynthesis